MQIQTIIFLIYRFAFIILRYNFSINSMFVGIQDEIEYIKCYENFLKTNSFLCLKIIISFQNDENIHIHQFNVTDILIKHNSYFYT